MITRLHPTWIISGLMLCACHHPTAADDLEVPAAYPTITAAISRAVDGDTIRVAPGTYIENIDFLGKRITVTSHFASTHDWRTVESTVIVGGQPLDTAAGSTVSFRTDEDRDSVLQGFTITGGSGTTWIDPQYPDYSWRGGGGIFCFRSSPTIRFNLITGNRVDRIDGIDGAQAGGILCYGGNPLIANNRISLNHAEYGGGLVVDYSGATVRNTVISHNTGGDSYGGGGVWTIGSSDQPISFTNCAIIFNSSPTRGGAMYVWSSLVSVRSSILWANQQAAGHTVFTTGGGRVDLSYSVVEGGFNGDNNVDVDPMLADTATALLAPASPCVDAGDPAADLQDIAHPTAPNRAHWPSRGTVRNDIGANGGPECAYLGTVINPAPRQQGQSDAVD